MRANHGFASLMTLASIVSCASSFGVQPLFLRLDPVSKQTNRLASLLRRASNDKNDASASKPKVVIFDLDGCLWRPEMYELLYYSGGRGAPFRPDPSVKGQLLTRGDEPVYLLGNVRDVMKDLWTWKSDVIIGISSRTDEPNWARELLKKFEVGTLPDGNGKEHFVALQDVFQGGPIEIAHDSKVNHFKRISKNTDANFEDMLFFDNESGNCREVARLGVTVAYAPDGVTKELWNVALENFPQTQGDVIGLDIYGYDSLEGAKRFY